MAESDAAIEHSSSAKNGSTDSVVGRNEHSMSISNTASSANDTFYEARVENVDFGPLHKVVGGATPSISGHIPGSNEPVPDVYQLIVQNQMLMSNLIQHNALGRVDVSHNVRKRPTGPVATVTSDTGSHAHIRKKPKVDKNKSKSLDFLAQLDELNKDDEMYSFLFIFFPEFGSCARVETV